MDGVVGVCMGACGGDVGMAVAVAVVGGVLCMVDRNRVAVG